MKKQIKNIAIPMFAFVCGIFISKVAFGSSISDVAIQESTSYGQAIVEGLKRDICKLEQENKELSKLNLKLAANQKSLKEKLNDAEARLDEYQLEDQLDNLTDSEWDLLYRTVTAEAGYNSAEAQKNVTWVILNRVDSSKFPDTITEVIKAPGQFNVIANGMYKTVKVTDFTVENVQAAYLEYFQCDTDGEMADGALFFCKGTFSGREYLFTDEVHHNFFK